MKGNRTGKGHFQVKGSEPLAKKPVMARLPVSIDTTVRELAGDELSNWIREAIAEKLEREQHGIFRMNNSSEKMPQQDMSA